MKRGDQISFRSEPEAYTVQAADDRFIVATKPYPAKKSYYYVLVDLQRGVRGPSNMLFGLPCDVDNEPGALDVLGLLRGGELEVTRRNPEVLSPEEMQEIWGARADPDKGAID